MMSSESKGNRKRAVPHPIRATDLTRFLIFLQFNQLNALNNDRSQGILLHK